MRIICAACQQDPALAHQAVLGEKCSRCGSELVFEVFRGCLPCASDAGHLPAAVRRFACRQCAFLFDEGQGGDSHTLCPMHFAAARLALTQEGAAAGLLADRSEGFTPSPDPKEKP